MAYRRQLITNVGEVRVLTTEPYPADHPFHNLMRYHETLIESPHMLDPADEIIGSYDSWEEASGAHRACVRALVHIMPFIESIHVETVFHNLPIERV